MSKFKVGDRVKNVKPVASTKKTGIFGTVVSAGHSYDSIGVHFDENVGGHNCGLYSYSCKDGYGWYCKEEVIELVDKNIQSIHITVNGTTTVAVLKYGKNIVKRAEAKLSPNDTFNFETGAEIAFNRLFGVEPFKPCDSEGECKELVKCNNTKFTIGSKVIVHGKIIDGCGRSVLKKYKGEIGTVVDKKQNNGLVPKWNKGRQLVTIEYDDGTIWCINADADIELASSEPQVKEVKRKAKVGEWVKIVNPLSDNEQYYQKDDICKCIESKGDSDSGCYVTSRGTHPCNRGKNTSYLYNSEYVVLENYTPQQKTYTQAELDEAVKAERERVYADVKKIFEKGE